MGATFTNLLYHIVFSTKDRRPLITPEFRDRLYEYIGGIVRGQGGVQLCLGGADDHVHILAKSKADVSVSKLLQAIKANSSKWANEQGHTFEWQSGYAAFSVSESQVGPVRQYIANQETHHRKQSFKEELIALLVRHGIAYDERYIWA